MRPKAKPEPRPDSSAASRSGTPRSTSVLAGPAYRFGMGIFLLVAALVFAVADGHGARAEITTAKPAAPLNLVPLNRATVEPPVQQAPVQQATAPVVPRIKTRFGQHKGFRRIVFEWAGAVKYRLVNKNGTATVWFGRPGRYDLSRFVVDLQRVGIKVTEIPGSENLVVKIRFPASQRLRHYRSGGIVVIDILDRRQRSARADSAPKKQARKAPKSASNTAPKSSAKSTNADNRTSAAAKTQAPSQNEVDRISVPPRHKIEELAAPQPPPVGAGNPAAAPADSGVDHATGKGRAATAPSGGVADAALPSQPEPGSGDAPRAVASRSGNNLTMRFEWPAPVAMAVFRRGRHIWLVFSSSIAPSLDSIRSELGGAYFAIERIEHDRNVVIRLSAARSLNPVLRRNGRSWIVEVKERSRQPKTAIVVSPRPHAAKGAKVLLRAGASASVVKIVDPEVGDSLFVVPVTAPGLGVELEREFAEFRLLSTSQGVVVEAHSDAVQVQSAMDGVVVGSGRGLRLSGNKNAGFRKKRGKSTAATIFDFAAWGNEVGGAEYESFFSARQRLQSAIIMASDADRNPRRLALARFYFGQGYAVDALGLLRRAESDDKEFIDDPAVRALRGAARLLTNDLDGAADDLAHRTLDDEPEVALWRGALASTQRKWRAAVAHFGRARGLLRYYPPRLKVRFGLLAAEAELAAGTIYRVRAYLNMLADSKLSRNDRYEMQYLQGRVLEQAGETDAALALWENVAKTATGPGRIKAEIARIDQLRSHGKLKDVDEAIATMDRLRFAWRGDALEFSVLHLLGRLYLDKNDYRRGFDTMRRAMKYYPGLARDRQLVDDMQNAFTRLFVNGAADDMPPVKALALFQGFRELVPKGSRGNVMIEKLADRLVAVDLLSRAGELLADQIASRLRGNEKARVGARLALVYLLDQNPGEALNALEATSIPDMPLDLATQRRWLQARALSALGQNERAMSLIAGDQARDADLLRADIHWREQNWAEAAKVLARLVESVEIPDGEEKFSESNSRLVLRWAVALALTGNSAELAEMRRRFDAAMESGPYSDAYRVIATEIQRGVAFDYESIAQKIAEVDRFQAFMANYRERLQTSGLSAIN